MIRYKLVKAQLTGTIYPKQVETQSFMHDDMNEALTKRFGSIAPAVLSDAVRIINEQLAEGDTVAMELESPEAEIAINQELSESTTSDCVSHNKSNCIHGHK